MLEQRDREREGMKEEDEYSRRREAMDLIREAEERKEEGER